MAQATLDPSVVDAPPQEAMGDTDELLSKLAGEEIDHLLAEAEAGRTAPPPAPVVVKSNEPPPAPVAESKETAEEIDELLSGMEGAVAPEAESPAAPVVQVAPVEKAAAPAVEPPVAPPPEVVEEARLQVLAAELQVDPPGAAAIAELDEKIAAPPPPAPILPEAVPITDDHVPLLLWPLIAINAPFAACPRSLRRLLGWVSVVTLLNAIGVFIYVTVLKKHH